MVVVVDIDGTIAKVGDRLKYLEQKPKDWDAFYNACFNDEPYKDIVSLVQTFIDAGCTIVFCTGRRDSVRTDTLKWLNKHFKINHTNDIGLLMRPSGDKRHDTEVKPELLYAWQEDRLDEKRDYFIDYILEDRNSMVKRWRELGYRCLQVQEGDF